MPMPKPTSKRMSIQLVPTGGFQARETTRRSLREASSLAYPWAARCNPTADRAEATAAAWAEHHGMLQGDAVISHFRGVGVGHLAAMAYPDAEPRMLELIAEMMAWVFIQDDHYDTAPSHEQRPERLESRFESYMTILRSGVAPSGSEPAARALADLACRFSEIGSPAWYLHFTDTMRRFWMDGVVVETYYRARGLSPDPASYMAMRAQTVGVYVCLDLMELTLGHELPMAVREDPILRRITWLTSRIIAYVNDLFSYDKERRVGDVNNYLQVMRRCESMSLPAVIDHTVRVHDRELEQLCQLDGTVRDHGPQVRETVDRYIEGCRAWITGALAWQQVAGRYASGRALLRDGEPSTAARSG
jgi:5-epi-alpha-selinene synthase